MGKGKNGLVNPFKVVPGNFIEEQGQDDGDGKLDEEPPKADQAGVSEGPKKQGRRKDIPEVLEIVPGASRDALGVTKSFKDQLDAVNGKIGKDDVEGRQRQYQNIQVTVAVDPPAQGTVHGSSLWF
jgi:hypothetical protein